MKKSINFTNGKRIETVIGANYKYTNLVLTIGNFEISLEELVRNNSTKKVFHMRVTSLIDNKVVTKNFFGNSVLNLKNLQDGFKLINSIKPKLSLIA